MPAKKTSKKVPSRGRKSAKKSTAFSSRLNKWWQDRKLRIRDYLARRPHRSFRRTRRRDYVRSLDLPGYFSFTGSVLRLLWQHKKTYGLLILLVAIASALLSGVASQSIFTEFAAAIHDAGKGVLSDGWGEIGKAGILLATGLNGGFTGSLTEVQQVYAGLILLFSWLVTVWLLRAQLAGNRPRLRDGLYNAGAPIFPTFSLLLLFVIQLLPAAVAALVISTVVGSDLIQNGFLSMVFYLGCFLLVLLSVHLITSTFFALVIVTLPGMYPWQAFKTAGDLVVGRRLRVLLRLSWGTGVIVLAWIVVMIPIIIFSTWLQTSFKWSTWIPIVPAALTLLSATTIIFGASYIYLLYRRMIEDDSTPA